LVDNGKGTHDWMLIQNEYTIPAGGAYISYFTPRMDSNGTAGQAVWFDDFSIVKKKSGSAINKVSSIPDESVIYPNPLLRGGNLMVRFTARPGRNFISLFNVQGQKIAGLYDRISTSSQNECLSLSTPFMEKGLYFVLIDNATGRVMRKLIVD
jgi:hypothetical protein